MRRIVFFTLATLSGAGALGQGLLDCIEPDVLRALVLQSQGEQPPVITTTVPAEIASLKMSGGFAWIGSAERMTGRADASTNTSQVTAAWRSTLAPEAARAATATALATSGWELQSMPGMVNVFTSAATPVPQTACRDGKPVNMSAAAMDGVTYVMFTIQRGNNNSICTMVQQRPQMATNALNRYLPHLEMPADPATGAGVRTQGVGGSSSNGWVTARVEFPLKDSAGNIARHFARQMAEQGWSSDASWSGASTAGSSWSKRGDANALIQSTLTVTAIEDRQFVAVLRATTLQ